MPEPLLIGEGEPVGEIGKERGTNRPVLICERYPRLILICGRQRTGKTYLCRVLIEELLRDPRNHFLIIDPKSEYTFQYRLSADFEIPTEVALRDDDGTLKVKFSDIDPVSLTRTLFGDGYRAMFQPSAILFETILKKTFKEIPNPTPKDAILTLLKYMSGLGDEDELGVFMDPLPSNVKNAVLYRLRTLDNFGVFVSDGGLTVEDILKNQITRLVIQQGEIAVKIVMKAVISRILKSRMAEAERYLEMEARGEKRPEWHRIILVAEEAHLYSKLPELIEYVKVGGYCNLGGIFISQRPASITPEVTSQINAIAVFRLVSDRDIEWVRRNSPMYVTKETSDIFKRLATGECVFITEDDIIRIKVRSAKTLHMGRTVW